MKKSQSGIIKITSLRFLRDGEKGFWINNDEFVKRIEENHFL
jgi:predicted Zn-dependent protease